MYKASEHLLDALLGSYDAVRAFTETLCAPLETEDFMVQSMSDASPTKWHIAHTSWFFETFILKAHANGYTSPHPQYDYLFNSYYNAVGERHCRDKRGFISRPTVQQTFVYRRAVDDAMRVLLCDAKPETARVLAPLVTLGLHHEQQHQELLLTDIKHAFSMNPLLPVYRARAAKIEPEAAPLRWKHFAAGLCEIGHDGADFCFDNEEPRHRVFLEEFALAARLVTNAEYSRFIEAGGYAKPELWLSAGWTAAQDEEWRAPLYWEKRAGAWHEFTLSGLRLLAPHEPVCHVSYFEADAYARWAGARLPTEFEWERAAASTCVSGNFADDEIFHPCAVVGDDGETLQQLFGDLWEWTRSQYSPYPGYAAQEGALGEYNGKFMCNQFVLRGGSCASTRSHLRATYRNFFPPEARWQFSGIRLAKDES